MDPYILQGTVLPERAQISLQFKASFTHVASGVRTSAKVSIVLNQVIVWVDGEHEWDIFDLRNLVRYLVQNYLAMVSYLKGYAYELEMFRVLNQSRGIDYVFGVETPCISERNQTYDIQDSLVKLRQKTLGPNGLFLRRCFSDLASSLKQTEDAGFYCYRAVESLRHHCAAINDLSASEKRNQWEKFRAMAGCTEDTLKSIKASADPLRHGGVAIVTPEEHTKLLTSTWKVVESYLGSI